MEHRPGSVIRPKGPSRGLNKLSDLRIQAFIRKAKQGVAPSRRLTDGGGLYLAITPAGTPVWRVKYRFSGRERVYAAGVYPAVSLEEARSARDRVKGCLKVGQDPVQARRLDKANAVASAAETFAALVAQWLEKRRGRWSDVHYRKSARALERDVLPMLGNLPIKDITPALVASVITSVTRRGARDTAAKVLQHEPVFFGSRRPSDYGLTIRQLRSWRSCLQLAARGPCRRC